MTNLPYAESDAVFSECELYRYWLYRRWEEEPEKRLHVIGLNPSTADAGKDDPTVRRCVGYAKAWGFGGIIVTNLFAYRSTDPKALRKVEDPVGPKTDIFLSLGSHMSELTICAWGTGGHLKDRHDTVVANLMGEGVKLHALGTTKDGYPKHPLYLPKELTPVPL